MDDKSIITLLFARDDTAIAELEKKYGGLCRSLISCVLKDPLDAEEVLSSVFMRIWQSVPPAKPQNLKAYAAKIARNEAISHYRRIKERGKYVNVSLEEMEDFLPAGTQIEDELEARLLTQAINRFLGGLDARKRSIFVKRYWCFRSVREIAEELSLPETRVSDILFKTKRSLKQYLIKERLIDE